MENPLTINLRSGPNKVTATSLDIPLVDGIGTSIGSMNLYPEYGVTTGKRPPPGPAVDTRVPPNGPIIAKVPYWPECALPKNVSDATVYMGYRIGTMCACQA